MNLLQRFNVTATFAVAVAVSNGISSAVKGSSLCQSVDPLCLNGNVDFFALAIFSLFFNFKACFENYKFFGEQITNSKQKGWRFYGFLIGLSSWITWIISGSLSADPTKSAAWLAVTIFISTAWVIQHIFERRTFKDDIEWKKRTLWLVFNAMYIAILLVYLNYPGEFHVLAFLFVPLIADYITSEERITTVGHDK